MSAVLLLLEPMSDTPRAVAYALDRARELGAQLVAIVVIDPQLSGRVTRKLEDAGLVGEKLSESVVGCLERDQRNQGARMLEGLAAAARQQGTAATTFLEEGELNEVVSRCCAGHEIKVAVVAAEKRSWLGRWLAPDISLRLPHCEIKVIEG